MKRATFTIGLLLTMTGCATAQTTVPSAAPATVVPKIDLAGRPLTLDTPIEQVLDALDQVGRGLKDFDANVSMTREDTVDGGNSKQIGKVSYQVVGEGSARVHVVFDKRIVGKNAQDKKIEYLLEDGWLTDRNYDPEIKQEIRRQVVKPGQKMNLLKLGEGPFPLPIGQKREDVLAAFDVKKIVADKEDPANTVHLELDPKPGTSFQRKFKTVDVWVDLQSHFPVRIQTQDKNETTFRTTDLTKIRVNAGLTDADFTLPKIPNDWVSTQEPYQE